MLESDSLFIYVTLELTHNVIEPLSSSINFVHPNTFQS